MFKEIISCRICKNDQLDPIINLGQQKFTSIFPADTEEFVPSGPLEAVKCRESSAQHCGLVQLKHTFDQKWIYGQSYGYRSGLNSTIVHHLKEKYDYLLKNVSLNTEDIILDIGSNDGTFLNFFSDKYRRIGIDPLALKFKEYYSKNISIIPEFLSKEKIASQLGSQKAKIITSLSMFYDVESPFEFVKDIEELLDDDGVWLLEQSYLPTMLINNAYDTICHEHLEYYALKQIKWMADRAGLKIVDVGLSSLNGGSFYVAAAKRNSVYKENIIRINKFLHYEQELRLDDVRIYEDFNKRISANKSDLSGLLKELQIKGRKIIGFGASTKGNVILQFCNISTHELDCIVEVNEDKFGRVTPGTNIPIVPQTQITSLKPDYVLVLPWHFKDFIVAQHNQLFDKQTNLIFPLPEVEVVCLSDNQKQTGLLQPLSV